MCKVVSCCPSPQENPVKILETIFPFVVKNLYVFFWKSRLNLGIWNKSQNEDAYLRAAYLQTTYLQTTDLQAAYLQAAYLQAAHL